MRLSYVHGFPVNSGFLVGWVNPYTLVDFNLYYWLFRNTELSLSLTNLLNHKHREIVGAPGIGQLMIL